MSVEVKFRAWLKDLEIMQIVSELNMWNLGHIITVDEDNFPYKTSGNVNYILMQYTGLKDKNGVEIYTGDICEVKYLNSSYDSEFVTDIYEVSQVRYAFRFLRKNRAISLELDKAFEVRVIGNIYENRELLN